MWPLTSNIINVRPEWKWKAKLRQHHHHNIIIITGHPRTALVYSSVTYPIPASLQGPPLLDMDMFSKRERCNIDVAMFITSTSVFRCPNTPPAHDDDWIQLERLLWYTISDKSRNYSPGRPLICAKDCIWLVHRPALSLHVRYSWGIGLAIVHLSTPETCIQ